MSTILVKDILNNKEYIYNITTDNIKNEFIKCYEFLKNKCINVNGKLIIGENNNDKDNEFLKYSINELFNHCEIFYDKQVIKKGWVWNSSDLEKQVIYELKQINILNNNNVITNNHSTQTDDLNVQKSIRTNTYNTYEQHNCQYQSTFFSDTMASLCKKMYSVSLLDTISESSEDSKYCDKPEIPEIKLTNENDNPYKLELGNGYCKDLFLNNFQKELKEKLASPNHGLKINNNNYFY